jgi:hypothetical protein
MDKIDKMNQEKFEMEAELPPPAKDCANDIKNKESAKNAVADVYSYTVGKLSEDQLESARRKMADDAAAVGKFDPDAHRMKAIESEEERISRETAEKETGVNATRNATMKKAKKLATVETVKKDLVTGAEAIDQGREEGKKTGAKAEADLKAKNAGNGTKNATGNDTKKADAKPAEAKKDGEKKDEKKADAPPAAAAIQLKKADVPVV